MLHGVLGGEKRGRQIVQAVFDLDLEMWVRQQCLYQIAFDVGRSREAVVLADLMLPIPIVAHFIGAGVIFLVLTELEVVAYIGVKRSGIGSGNGVRLRIGVGVFS